MSTAKRLLSLLLCLVMIFAMFGCSSGDESYSDSDTTNSGQKPNLPSQAPENYVSLAEHETAYYRIVYEKGLQPAVTKKITQHVATLQTKIGVRLS